MRTLLISIAVLCFQLSFGQTNTEEQLLLAYPNHEITIRYTSDFNNDDYGDVLFILSPKARDTADPIDGESLLSKNKVVIFFGEDKDHLEKVFDDDFTFPCLECSGKSDINIANLTFKNNLLSYTTCIAPFGSDQYSVIEFTLKFVDHRFKINNYQETYFSIEEDKGISIRLNCTDFNIDYFNYYDWVADKSWLDHIIISSENLTKINNFAMQVEKVDPMVAIKVLQNIVQSFPDRAVTYLNLSNVYWAIGERDLAQENYDTYIELMRLKKHDLKKELGLE